MVFLLDQLSKRIIQRGLEHRQLQLGGVVTLRFLSSSKRYYRAAPARMLMTTVWCLATAAAFFLAMMNSPAQNPWLPIAMGSAVGGAAGNLCDVLRDRAVRDFIDLGWWPVFNVADIAIVAGIAGILIGR